MSDSENEDNIFSDDESVEEIITKPVSKKNAVPSKLPKVTIQDSDDEDGEYNESDSDNDDIDIENDEQEMEIDGDEGEDDDEDNIQRSTTNNDNTINVMSESILPNEQIYQDNEEDEELDETYLQKFDTNIRENYVDDFHPETSVHNYEEINALVKVVRNKDNIIVDPLHRTIPILTKYERTRVLGQRAKQINNGSRPYVSVPEDVIDGYLIAELELEQKRVPFIIRRPLPGNAGCEYWKVSDLESVSM